MSRLATSVVLTLGAAAILSLVAGCRSGGRTTPEAAAAPSPDALARLDPAASAMNTRAPELFRVRFETTAGPFVVEVHRSWSPHGADRFYCLAANGFYDGARFFRVVPGFVVQFGLKGMPEIDARFSEAGIPDDPVAHRNQRRTVVFAKTTEPNSRTTQIFINLVNNPALDSRGFAPFGEVVEGMANVSRINARYGQKPDQMEIAKEGNRYLDREFPLLDYIRSTSIVPR